MSTTTTADPVHDALTALCADPAAAYTFPTPVLEQALARTPGLMHGRRPGDPVFDAVSEVRRHVCSALRARAVNDARTAADAKRAELQARMERLWKQHPTDDGPTIIGGYGAKVPVGPQGPRPLPPQTRRPEPVDAL